MSFDAFNPNSDLAIRLRGLNEGTHTIGQDPVTGELTGIVPIESPNAIPTSGTSGDRPISQSEAVIQERDQRAGTLENLTGLFEEAGLNLPDILAAEEARRAEAERFEQLLQDEFLISQGLISPDFRLNEAQSALDALLSQQTELQGQIDASAGGSQGQRAHAQNVLAPQLEDITSQIEAAQAELELQQGRFDARSAAQSEAQALIDEQAERAIELGTGDIERGVQRQLEMLREEAGASRGLRFTDTPVFDDAQRVSEAGIEQTGRLALGVRQGQAAQALDQSRLETQQQLQQQQFQSQLSQQALQNRMALFGQHTGFGTSLLGATPSAQDFMLGLRGTRAPKGPSTQDKLLSGGVSVLTGLAAGGFFSDKNLKKDISEMTIPELAEKFSQLSVSTWSYITEAGQGDDRHLGAMAQDLKEVFGIGDGKTVSLVDATGIMTAAGKLAAATLKEKHNG